MPQLLAAEIAAHRRSALLSGGKAHEFGPLVAAQAGRGAPLDTAWHSGQRAPTATEWAAFDSELAPV
ncbi:hypothetical protein [Deinococcus sp. Marseille-Q6407]|uniref:hypothetical protein n=1 Tax=Deinococcus sp. Marseille-Q6407 TaxID=2969223 RepID=UPI0021BE763E|nr:hypothetical protein [Deinococcus sp. Marseille-Q6407]